MEGGVSYDNMSPLALMRYAERAYGEMTAHHPTSVEGLKGWAEGTQMMNMLGPPLPGEYLENGNPEACPKKTIDPGPNPPQMWEAMRQSAPKHVQSKKSSSA